MIGELKNDVDDKGTKIEEDRKAQYKYFLQICLLLLLGKSTFFRKFQDIYFLQIFICFQKVNPPFYRKAQEAAFEALNNELKEIREEFKTEGFLSSIV